jgi:hypothetical protein
MRKYCKLKTAEAYLIVGIIRTACADASMLHCALAALRRIDDRGMFECGDAQIHSRRPTGKLVASSRKSCGIQSASQARIRQPQAWPTSFAFDFVCSVCGLVTRLVDVILNLVGGGLATVLNGVNRVIDFFPCPLDRTLSLAGSNCQNQRAQRDRQYFITDHVALLKKPMGCALIRHRARGPGLQSPGN